MSRAPAWSLGGRSAYPTEEVVVMRVLQIKLDKDPDNPRNWSNLGTMVCWCRRYCLGDDHDFSTPNEFHHWLAEEEKLGEKFLVLPLYLLDHGVLRMSVQSFNDHWDSGQVGYIYVSYSKIRSEYGVKRVTKKVLERARQCLIGEVEVYDQYLCGDVYGFAVLEVDDLDVRVIDSCYGFYGADPNRSGLSDYVRGYGFDLSGYRHVRPGYILDNGLEFDTFADLLKYIESGEPQLAQHLRSVLALASC